jgi:nitric oxide reductase subunit B
MKYPTQKVALAYFTGAMILFVVQMLMGSLAATVYVAPNFLSELLPFNIMRMMHTNALIVWLLMAFFGCAYYIVRRRRSATSSRPCWPTSNWPC